MQVSLQRCRVLGGLLLTATMVCTPLGATEVGAVGLPENFLEYLGTLVEQEGGWVDALELNDGALPEGEVQQVTEQDNDDLASSSKGAPTVADEAEEK